MQRHLTRLFFGLSLIFIFGTSSALAKDLNKLIRQVEKLNLQRQGYVLGAKLTKDQLRISQTTPEQATAENTFKFRDENLYVVAQKGSNRILVIYEQFENASRKQIQDVVGDLYMSFDDPTVMAHDKIVYWAWTKKGKVSSTEFDAAKEKNKNLDILATVKCISEVKIMEKKEQETPGYLYYIISSDPVLKQFAKPDA